MPRSDTIAVRTASAAYTVEIGPGLLASVGERLDALLGGTLASGRTRAFILTSPEIHALWGQRLLSGFAGPLPVLTIPAGEASKRMATAETLCEQLAEARADRDSILLALGGGVIGDLVGFVAAIYMRGLGYVQLPTTALAQIDSSVGGKTGANLAAGKNLVGAFHHPLAVFADTDTLTTLPPRELRAGLQEAIKAGIIRDANLFAYMEAHTADLLAGDPATLQHVIAASARMKAALVGEDERESGPRMLLNFGHTLGHAIEAATGYGGLLHGEAVAWGMLAALHIARARHMLPTTEADRMEHLIRALGPLPAFTADPAQLVALTASDKKNRGGTRSFILPTAISHAEVFRNVTETELLAAATHIVQQARDVPTYGSAEPIAAGAFIR